MEIRPIAQDQFLAKNEKKGVEKKSNQKTANDDPYDLNISITKATPSPHTMGPASNSCTCNNTCEDCNQTQGCNHSDRCGTNYKCGHTD